jgi:hypothetical protein
MVGYLHAVDDFVDVFDVCNGVFQLYAVNAFLGVLDTTLYD